MPCSDDIWRNTENLSAEEQVLAIRIEERQHAPVLFSDLLRILLDRQEAKPIMRPVGYELCLFGLQASIWKVSHDPDLFFRLTGNGYVPPTQSSSSNSLTAQCGSPARDNMIQDLANGNGRFNDMPKDSNRNKYLVDVRKSGEAYADGLGKAERQMLDMRNDRDRVEAALEAWHRGFETVPPPRVTQHRDTLMSSLLLWYMSYLRLSAPLHHLHDISYRAGEGQEGNVDIVEQVHGWAGTREAILAVSQALKICQLVQDELKRPSKSQASFNFLAFATLHHATVVLWTMSQIASDPALRSLDLTKSNSTICTMLVQRDTTGLLSTCARLFRTVSPLGGASFGLAADRLSIARFPLMNEQTRAASVF